MVEVVAVDRARWVHGVRLGEGDAGVLGGVEEIEERWLLWLKAPKGHPPSTITSGLALRARHLRAAALRRLPSQAAQ